jgi:hypothetical protein
MPYLLFLRSTLQSGAVCLRKALACNTAAFPDTTHAVLLQIRQPKIWITLTWRQKLYCHTHKNVPTVDTTIVLQSTGLSIFPQETDSDIIQTKVMDSWK